MKSILIILMSGITLAAAAIKVGWDANPASDNVTFYRVNLVDEAQGVTNKFAVEDLEFPLGTNIVAGVPYRVYITAVAVITNTVSGTNQVVELESDPSEQLRLLVPTTPTGLRIAP